MESKALFCVVWLNPDKKLHPQARLLQSFCTNTPTPTPYSFSESALESQAALKNAFHPTTEADFDLQLPLSSPQRPLILSTTLANTLLGWNIFSPAKDLSFEPS
jgi:hypothetical protein